ncbi:MAG: LacI family DNA-binding transcriptional regulator [Lacisediminihabitans sp.]
MTTVGDIPKRRAPRADVARYAGVSPAVVSYTVNAGPKPVADATRARVLEAIRVLGYRPNAAARTLKIGSTKMLGLIVPDSSNPFFAQYGHAIEDAAAAQGYALLVVNTGGAPESLAPSIRTMASRQVDGMLIAFQPSMDALAEISSAGIPTVLLNQTTAVSGLPAVGSDLYAGARSGVQHLIGHGHRSIAFVGDSDPLDERQRGWRDALTAAGLHPGPIAASDFTREGGYLAGRELLSENRRASAVFVSSDMQASGVLRAFHEAGLSLPDDFAVVSLDGSPESEYSWPALTTASQSVVDMAAEAVRHVITPTEQTRFTLYPTTLVVRQSCGCAWPEAESGTG